MKVNGNTIVLDAGEQITIMAQDGQQTPVQPIQNIVAGGINLIIKNETGRTIQSTGEIRLYVADHIGINTYFPGARADAGALYTFNAGENSFIGKGINAEVNGGGNINEWIGKPITEVRFYDQRHWNNIDAGFNATIDTSDSKCDKTLKTDGTYVIKITNI